MVCLEGEGDVPESEAFLLVPCRAVELRSCSAFAAMSRRSCLLFDILIVIVLFTSCDKVWAVLCDIANIQPVASTCVENAFLYLSFPLH